MKETQLRYKLYSGIEERPVYKGSSVISLRRRVNECRLSYHRRKQAALTKREIKYITKQIDSIEYDAQRLAAYIAPPNTDQYTLIVHQLYDDGTYDSTWYNCYGPGRPLYSKEVQVYIDEALQTHILVAELKAKLVHLENEQLRIKEATEWKDTISLASLVAKSIRRTKKTLIAVLLSLTASANSSKTRQ